VNRLLAALVLVPAHAALGWLIVTLFWP